MSYVLVGILFLLIASAFVAYLVMTSAKRSGGDDAGDRTAGDRDQTGAPAMGADETPFGDTSEHAGETRAEGETVGGQDAGEAGGTGRPVLSGDTDNEAGRPSPPEPGRRFQRDPAGGEAEARPFTES